jgi:hypothetical protein
VQVGSSTIAIILIRDNALTGHKAIQAAHPKHLSLFTIKR